MYWGKPVPSFGDPQARVLILGLAPGAHGSNRTGRMFTGDGSGTMLYRVLYKTGFASQPTSTSRDDGLILRDAYITAAAHCAPPGNKPAPEELRNCRPYFERELGLLKNLKVLSLEDTQVIGLAPPFVVTDAEIERIVSALDEALAAVAAELAVVDHQ